MSYLKFLLDKASCYSLSTIIRLEVESLIFGVLSLWVFHFLAKKLLPKSEKVVFAISAIYIFAFGTRLLEGNIANAENFMLLPIVLSAYLIVSTDFIKKIWVNRISFFAGLVK